MAWTDDQLFSSKRQDWATPWALFNEVNKEFNFVLDAAASKSNTKCPIFLNEEVDSLVQPWAEIAKGESVWLNPPYGRSIGKWIRKASEESVKGCAVVCLTFARTDTKWWHDWAMKAAEIRLIPGRVTFIGGNAAAPAPSCLIVFDEKRRMPTFKTQYLPRK